MTTVGRLQVDLVGNTRHFKTSMRAASRVVTTFHHDLQNVGFAAAALVAPLLALGKTAATTFGEIQRTVVTAGAKFGSTAKELKELDKRVMDVAKTSEYTGKQVADLMNTLAQRGVKQKDAEAAAPHIINFAIAAETEATTAAELLVSALRQTGRGFADAGAMSDLLSSAVGRTALDVENLATALKYVGPLAHSSGLGMEEMLSTAASLTEVFGSGASQAFRGLRSMLGQMAKNNSATGDAADALRELGIAQLFVGRKTAPPMDEVMNALLGTIGRLGGDLNGLQNLLARAFPNNARTVAAAMLELREVFERNKETLADYVGFAGGLAQKRIDTFQGRILILNSNFEALQKTIGEKLEPAMNRLIDIAQGAIDYFSSLSDETVVAIAEFAAVGTAILGAITLMSLFAQVLAPFAALIANIGRLFLSMFTLPALAAAAAVIALVTLAGVLENEWPNALGKVKDSFSDLIPEIKRVGMNIVKFLPVTWFAKQIEGAKELIDSYRAYSKLRELGFKSVGGQLLNERTGDWVNTPDDVYEQAIKGEARGGLGLPRGINSEQLPDLIDALETIGRIDPDAPKVAKEMAKAVGAETEAGLRAGAKSIAVETGDVLKAGMKTGFDMVKTGLFELVQEYGPNALNAAGLDISDYDNLVNKWKEIQAEARKFIDALNKGRGGAKTPVNDKALSPEKKPGESAKAPSKDFFNQSTFGDVEGAAKADLNVGGLGQIAELVQAFAGAATLMGGIVAIFTKLITSSAQFQQITEAIGAILENVSNVLGVVLEPLKPIIGAISIFLKTVLAALSPVLEAMNAYLSPLAPIIMVLGEVLAMILAPFSMLSILFDLLAAVTETLATALMTVINGIKWVVLSIIKAVAKPINWLLEALAKFLDFIADAIETVSLGLIGGGALRSAAQKVRENKINPDEVQEEIDAVEEALRDPFGAFQRMMEEATEEFEKLAGTTAGVTEQLKNVPDGYKVARKRLEAQNIRTQGMALAGHGAQVPGLASGGIVTSPGLFMLAEGGEDEAVIPLSKLSGLGMQIGHVTVVANDPDEMYRKLDKMGRRRSLLRGRVGAGVNGPRYRG